MREKIENMLAVYKDGKPKAPIKKRDIGDSLDSLLDKLKNIQYFALFLKHWLQVSRYKLYIYTIGF